MVHQSIIEARLNQLGIKRSRWFKPEIRELSQILMDNEKIITVVTGRYFGGFALLVATDHRLLLIDKKVLFLTVDDIRYDMISEIDFNSRLFDSTIHIYTVNKQHSFTSMKGKQLLRNLVGYIQQRITEIRHYQQQVPLEPEHDRVLAPAVQPLVHAASTVSNVSHQIPKVVGSAAMHGAHWMHVNPYTKNALITRTRDWSRI
jgi:Bacterial PH domain